MNGARKADNEDVELRRSSRPKSFIFVLDSLLENDEVAEPLHGQTLRSQKQLEEIFGKANLEIYKRSAAEPLPEPFRDVMVWVLY